jgi:hypothetical protein
VHETQWTQARHQAGSRLTLLACSEQKRSCSRDTCQGRLSSGTHETRHIKKVVVTIPRVVFSENASVGGPSQKTRERTKCHTKPPRWSHGIIAGPTTNMTICCFAESQTPGAFVDSPPCSASATKHSALRSKCGRGQKANKHC